MKEKKELPPDKLLPMVQRQMEILDTWEPDEDGVMPGDLSSDLDRIEGAVPVKVAGICHVIKHKIPSEIDELKALVAACQARIRAKERKSDGLKNYLGLALELMRDDDGEPIRNYKTGPFTVYRRKSESVEIDVPPDQLEEPFRECRIEYVPVKAAIKEAIREGKPVHGARLVEKETWAIR